MKILRPQSSLRPQAQTDLPTTSDATLVDDATALVDDPTALVGGPATIISNLKLRIKAAVPSVRLRIRR